VKSVADFRRALDDKSIDALVIAAPDHWHAPAAILAMSAGKHVYLEKPCGTTRAKASCSSMRSASTAVSCRWEPSSARLRALSRS